MNDAEMIADRLADEIEGGQKYRELAEQAIDTKVKALFLDIASEEDSHAAWLRKISTLMINSTEVVVNETNTDEMKRLKSELRRAIIDGDKNKAEYLKLEIRKLQGEIELRKERSNSISTAESRRNKGEALFGTRKNGNIFCPATTYSSKETVRDTYPGSYAIISVDGGWLVFMTASDYTTWQGQR